MYLCMPAGSQTLLMALAIIAESLSGWWLLLQPPYY